MRRNVSTVLRPPWLRSFQLHPSRLKYSSPGGVSLARHGTVTFMKKLLTSMALALVLSAGIFTNGSSAVAGPDPTKMVCGTTNCATDAPKSPVDPRDPVKAKQRPAAASTRLSANKPPKRKIIKMHCRNGDC